MHRLVVGLAHFFGIHAIVIAHDVHDVCNFVDSSQMASLLLWYVVHGVVSSLASPTHPRPGTGTQVVGAEA